MKKLLLILLCLPMIGFGQLTYVPDDNFEQELINLGYDNVIDDYLLTASINTVTNLNVNSQNISDLTGIEDFTALTWLQCGGNQLTILDVSNNTALTYLTCGDNQLTSLDLRNVNNMQMGFDCTNNPNLECINVDAVAWSTAFWTNTDPQHYFSNNCPPSAIEEHFTKKELLKVNDILGRETKQTNQPLFYIYDDGTVKKRIVIE